MCVCVCLWPAAGNGKLEQDRITDVIDLCVCAYVSRDLKGRFAN